MPFQTISDFAPRGLSSAQRAWQYGEDEETKIPEQPVPWASQAPTYTPSKSLGAQAADLGFSALGVVGSAFDIPGSMLRDAAALPTALWGSNDANVDYNPFNQLLPWNWFDQDGRTDGRELNRAWAGATGAVSDEDNWWNLGAGIGTEVLLDPLTYLTFGGGALTRGGDALSKIASRREIADVATQLARDANLRTKPVGKTVAQQVLTPRNVLDARAAAKGVDPATEYANFSDAARTGWFGRKVDVTDAEIESMLDDSIGGMARFRVPMLPRKWQDSKDGLLRDRFFGGRVGNLADLARVGRASDVAADVGMGTMPFDAAVPPASTVPPATEPMPPAPTQVDADTMFQPAKDDPVYGDRDIDEIFALEPLPVKRMAKLALNEIKSDMVETAATGQMGTITYGDVIAKMQEMVSPESVFSRQHEGNEKWQKIVSVTERYLERRHNMPSSPRVRDGEDIAVMFADTSAGFQEAASRVAAGRTPRSMGRTPVVGRGKPRHCPARVPPASASMPHLPRNRRGTPAPPAATGSLSCGSCRPAPSR